MLAAIAAVTAAGPALAGQTMSPPVVYAWFPLDFNDWSTRNVDWGAITHLCYRSVELMPDGTIREPVDRKRVASLVSEAHAHGVKVTVLVWGTTAANASEYLARNPDRAVGSLLEYVRANGLDGVNIDDETWEETNSATGKPNRELVTAFFHKLRKAFKAVRPDYHLSWAAPPVISAEDRYGTAWPDYASIAEELDALAIMSYTMNPPTAGWTGGPVPVAGGGRVGNHARDCVTLLRDYHEATGGRKGKLLLGIGLSRGGAEWDCRGDGPLAPIIGAPRDLSPAQARVNAEKNGRLFDAEQRYHWYRRAEGDHWVQGWYEDDESLGAKMALAVDEGLGGVCLWALDGANEPPETFALLRAYRASGRSPRGRGARLWGDCHCHSTVSDGMTDIPAMTPYYEAYGYDFRIQTDHVIIAVPDGKPDGKWMHSSDWESYREECARASTKAHLCIPGAELGWDVDKARCAAEGWCDIKLYPKAGASVPPESFFREMTFTGALKALRTAGHRVVIAHADQGAQLGILTGGEVDGLEVRWDIEETRPLLDRDSLRHWDRMLSAGHRVSLSAGSDSHQPDEWAGSGLRTVVTAPGREPVAIVDAVVAGRSYLSGTWHPDCYGGLGFAAHPNAVAGGVTRFTPWWEFPEGGARGKILEDGFRAALARGRCRREDYPVLESFTVNGAASGEEARAGKAEVSASWITHLPVTVVRLVADGRPVYELPASHAVRGKLRGGFTEQLDLTGVKYVRLEIEAAGPEGREYLLANPVYLKR